MSISIYRPRWQYTKKTLATLCERFMVYDHFCSVPVSLFSQWCGVPQFPLERCELWAELVIMSNDIQSENIENIVQVSGQWLSQKELLGIIGVSQDTISKVLRRVRKINRLTQGRYWHLLKTITANEGRALQNIMDGTCFYLCPGSGW